MVRIRLKRLGRKKRPFYRIVVTDQKNRRDGKPVCELGFYDPIRKQLKFDKAAAEAWIGKGAQPSTTVLRLMELASDNASEVLELPKKAPKNLAPEPKKEEAQPAAKAETTAPAEETEDAEEPAAEETVKEEVPQAAAVAD